MQRKKTKKMIQMAKTVISNNIQILNIQLMKITMKTQSATKEVGSSATKFYNLIKITLKTLNMIKKKIYIISGNKTCSNRNNNRIIKKIAIPYKLFSVKLNNWQ
jgi:esterase/lipase